MSYVVGVRIGDSCVLKRWKASEVASNFVWPIRSLSWKSNLSVSDIT